MTADQIVAAAAEDYVAARVALAGADKGGMMAALDRCDEAWHTLHTACGVPCSDVGDGSDDAA